MKQLPPFKRFDTLVAVLFFSAIIFASIGTPYGGTVSVAGGCPAGQISGVVFRDYNQNGALDSNEPLLQDVVVEIQDANGSRTSVATDVMGAFVSSGHTSGTAYRVHVRSADTGFYDGVASSADETETRFIATPQCGINLALSTQADYCQLSPVVSYSQFSFERFNHPSFGEISSVAGFDASEGSNSTDITSYDPAPKKEFARNKDTGTVWGLAYDKPMAQLAFRLAYQLLAHFRRASPAYAPPPIYDQLA